MSARGSGNRCVMRNRRLRPWTGAGTGGPAAADSRGGEPGTGAHAQGYFAGWVMTWKNTVGPFVFQASAGLASAVLLLGR